MLEWSHDVRTDPLKWTPELSARHHTLQSLFFGCMALSKRGIGYVFHEEEPHLQTTRRRVGNFRAGSARKKLFDSAFAA